jgi:hypothetical protein
MDVVRLKDAAKIGLVRLALAQALDRRRFVSEGFKEGIRELLSIEGLLSQFGNCLFDLNGVQFRLAFPAAPRTFLQPPEHLGL